MFFGCFPVYRDDAITEKAMSQKEWLFPHVWGDASSGHISIWMPVSAESYFPAYGDDAITQQAFSKQWRSFPEFGDEALVFVIYDTDDYFPVCRDEARRKSIKVTAFRSLFPVYGGEAGRAYSFLKKELLFPRIRR